MFPLRILMISQYGSGLSNPKAQFSGALSRQRDYAECMDIYHCIVPAAEGEEPVVVEDNLIIHPVAASGNIDFLRKARKKAKELHKEHTYTHFMVDNPHTAGFLGVFVKRDLGIPFVLHSMSDMIRNPWYQKERFSNRIKSTLIEKAVRSADVIRVSTQAEISRLSSAPFAHKLQRVSFYVDQTAVEKALSEVQAETKPKQLLYVGRLGPQKDLPVLLKAMKKVTKKHEDAQLVIVGGGPDEKPLKDQASQLGLDQNVTFTGAVPYDQVMKYFKEASAFVISSLHEGTCMVLHEAGLAKKPLVSTAFAGAIDLIENGKNGYLVEPRDIDGLAEKIISVIENPEEARIMGEENYRRTKLVDREYALSQWKQLCERLVAVK